MPTTPDPLSDAPSGSRQHVDEILDRLRGRGIRPGTATIRRVLGALGDPQLRVPLVLVAGTNGKGSTAALLASISRAAGERTGLFTSPALASAREQIQLDGMAVASEALAALLEAVIRAGERLVPGQLTEFEAMTAAAFLHFARSDVSLAIIEVGLGGREDATNVAADQIAILTSVGRDHQAYLGTDLAAIAREKAGVLRTGQPAVVGWLPRQAQHAVEEEAERLGVRPRFARDAIQALSRTPRGLAGQDVKLSTDRQRYALKLPLLGAHQARNLALAVLAAECLEQEGALAIDADTVSRGVATCRWPGRLEPVELADRTTVLIDAAHNQEGAGALRSFLDELARPYLLVFGAFRDKPTDAMLDALAPTARHVLLAPVDDPRSWNPLEVSRASIEARPAAEPADDDATTTTCYPSVAAALTQARALAAPRAVVDATPRERAMIVACGSLRVVAETKEWLSSVEARDGH